MAKPYLDDLENLLDRVAPAFGAGGDARDDIECRHFFSGAAAYVHKRIFMSLTPVGLALKLPVARREELMAAGGKALRYFPKAPIKTEYVVLPDTIMDRPAALASLIVESAECAKSASQSKRPD